MRVPPGSEREERKRVTVRVCFPGLRAGSSSGPKGFPEVQFHIFIFFSSFLFLISYFLYRFCILNSIDFKPVAKVFKN
jgi:hypothetical protein